MRLRCGMHTLGLELYQCNTQQVSRNIITNSTRARSWVGIIWVRRASVTLPTHPHLFLLCCSFIQTVVQESARSKTSGISGNVSGFIVGWLDRISLIKSYKIAVSEQNEILYQCNTCSSHSYNPNLTSGPSGPRRIGNFRKEQKQQILYFVVQRLIFEFEDY